jgi:hypothetical protein
LNRDIVAVNGRHCYVGKRDIHKHSKVEDVASGGSLRYDENLKRYQKLLEDL